MLKALKRKKFDPNVVFVNIQLDTGYLRFHGLAQIGIALAFFILSQGIIATALNLSIACSMLGIGIYNYARHITAEARITSLSDLNYYAVSTDWIRKNKTDPESFYIGKGATWDTPATQTYHQLSNLPHLGHIVKMESPTGGKIFLHNIIKPQEEHKFIRLNEHTIIAGTTGTGKTRCIELLVSQMVDRDEAVIVVDPKGDRDLLNRVYRLAVKAGRADDFQFFSLMHPNKSGTWDLFGDCVKAEEVANRMQSIMAESGGAETTDPFVSFCWTLIHATSNLLILVKKKVTPTSLYEALMLNPKPLYDYAKDCLGKCTVASERTALLEALNLYEAKVLNHPMEHKEKMTAVLNPALTILGTGELGRLLSPEVANIQIPDIIKNKRILYVYLGSMAQTRESATIGKLIVQNIVGHIGKSYGQEHNLQNFHLVVDEFYSVAFPGYIEMIGKSRAAGMHMYLGMQTSSDIAAAMGQIGLEQIVTNTANYICYRIPEKFFAETISEHFGKTSVPQKIVTRVISAGMDKADNLFRSSTSERMDMVEAPRVSPEMLTALPLGEMFLIARGLHPMKLVVPLLDEGECDDIPAFFEQINPEKPLSLGLLEEEEEEEYGVKLGRNCLHKI